MILYLDTSALVKLYVRERGSALVHRRVAEAEVIATSLVAYAEARAAFARLKRERPASGKRHRARIEQLDRDWERYARIELAPAVVRSAGDLAEQHGLRGFDAIHLASAKWLESADAGDVTFAAFDRRLAEAASAAGMPVIPGVLRARRRAAR